MARPTTEASAVSPFLSEWTAADANVSNTGANSPVRIPSGMLDDADQLMIITSGSDNTNAPRFHLILADLRRSTTGAVKAVIDSGVLAAVVPDRQQAEDNGSGGFLHPITRFDIRGFRLLGDPQVSWSLALVTLGGVGNTVRLLAWYGFSRRPA